VNAEASVKLEILDCGHVNTRAPKPGECGGTGYARIKHESGAEQRICYDCCAVRDRLDMLATGRAVLYLVGRVDNVHVTTHVVTNWPGTLEFKCFPRVVRRPGAGGFGAQRTDAWFIGPDGFIWHAINRGDMQLARCKRTKEKA
jgi:hypothetical protein